MATLSFGLDSGPSFVCMSSDQSRVPGGGSVSNNGLVTSNAASRGLLQLAVKKMDGWIQDKCTRCSISSQNRYHSGGGAGCNNMTL